jgi:hypothetical protein
MSNGVSWLASDTLGWVERLEVKPCPWDFGRPMSSWLGRSCEGPFGDVLRLSESNGWKYSSRWSIPERYQMQPS